MMESLSFRVAEYDAPLDLILQLITKHKLKITDIDISALLAHYMQIISQWQEQDLEVASAFLEMASRLVYMKTVSLLPRHEQESERLRQELSGQLIEYRLCQLAAQQLGQWNCMGDLFVREPCAIEVDETYTLSHPAGILFAALTDAMGKNARRMPPPRETFEPLVSRPVISVASKIFTVLRALRQKNQIAMHGLFNADTGRSGVIATFLALLELVKSKKIAVDDDQVRLRADK